MKNFPSKGSFCLLQSAMRWFIYRLPDGNDFLRKRFQVETGASGCSSGVEHNLAKVGVEGSNPFARSSFQQALSKSRLRPGFLLFIPLLVVETHSELEANL
jgi:hypothetical protein